MAGSCSSCLAARYGQVFVRGLSSSKRKRRMVKQGCGFRSSGTNCLPAIPSLLSHPVTVSERGLTLTQPGAQRKSPGKQRCLALSVSLQISAADEINYFWCSVHFHWWRQRKRTLVNQRNACQSDAITPTATLDPLTDLSDSATPFTFTGCFSGSSVVTHPIHPLENPGRHKASAIFSCQRSHREGFLPPLFPLFGVNWATQHQSIGSRMRGWVSCCQKTPTCTT